MLGLVSLRIVVLQDLVRLLKKGVRVSAPTVCQIGRTIGTNNWYQLPKVIGEEFPTIGVNRTYCYLLIVLLFYQSFGILPVLSHCL